MGTQRRANYVVALSGTGEVQSNFDTEMPEAAIDTAWPMTSDSYPNIEQELDRILDCSQQDLVAKEVLTRIMRFGFDFECHPLLLAIMSAYQMSIAAAPTGAQANQVQTFTRHADVTGGTWFPLLPVGSVNKRTPDLAWNVSAADLKTALENLNAIGRGNVQVTFAAGPPAVWTVTFINNLARAQLAQFLVNDDNLTGAGTNTITQAQTQAGSNFSHLLSRLTDFQTAAFGMICGYRNSARLPKRFKSIVVDSLTHRGSHASPRVTASVALIGSGEVFRTSPSYVLPECEIFRPIRFKDCGLVIDGVDYAANNLWRDYEMTLGNNVITDEDAYTGQDEDVHRLERADQRTDTINVGILGEDGDDIYVLGESLAEKAVALRVGRVGQSVTYNMPKGSISLRNPPITYDGTAKRSKVNLLIEGELIPGDATTPFTATANVDQSGAFLEVAS